MQPLQRLFDSDGNEVALFPMEYLYLSTARDPDEHQLLALDFFGWNALGRAYDCPCYAPFTGRVTYTGNDHNMIFQSINPVRLADGTLSNLTVLVAHSMTAPPSVGTVVGQGQLWYHSGNYGQSTGDHLHIEVARGHVGWDSSGTHLNNPSHLWDCLYVNDTTLSRAKTYNWREFQGGVIPSTKKKTGYNFVLFNRKRRVYLHG